MGMKEDMYDLLKDGLLHTRDELIEVSGCRPGSITFLLTTVRRDMLKRQEEIICQYYQRRLYYRLVVAVNPKDSQSATAPAKANGKQRGNASPIS